MLLGQVMYIDLAFKGYDRDDDTKYERKLVTTHVGNKHELWFLSCLLCSHAYCDSVGLD